MASDPSAAQKEREAGRTDLCDCANGTSRKNTGIIRSTWTTAQLLPEFKTIDEKIDEHIRKFQCEKIQKTAA